MNRLLVVFLVSTLMTRASAAQIVANGDSPTVKSSRRDMDAAKSLLDSLQAKEERYWQAHGTYTTDVSLLGLKRSAGPLVVVTFASGRSWSAQAGLPPFLRTCVAYVGTVEDFAKGPETATSHVAPSAGGVPVCDAPDAQ